MSRGVFGGLLSLVLVMALAHYLARERFPQSGTGAANDPVDTASDVRCGANQQVMATVIASYRVSHQGENPARLSDLVPQYVAAIPSCPKGGAYAYDRRAGTVSCPNGHRTMP
ncbi:MAG: hypothetical protein MUE60_10800 [Candidatus Eisenbacteria bacterium]|jgi:hypothetical protein|nr:hypothetical protein [Candidatus Eisenbacteria bacterium]